MAFDNLRKKLKATVAELDGERLQNRFDGLDLTPLADLPTRRPVRVGGEIKHLRIAPFNGVQSLEIRVDDGTGTCTAVFSGRPRIGGIANGRCILLEGVVYERSGKRILLNPAYTLLAH
jgi:hypothetical protein